MGQCLLQSLLPVAHLCVGAGLRKKVTIGRSRQLRIGAHDIGQFDSQLRGAGLKSTLLRRAQGMQLHRGHATCSKRQDDDGHQHFHQGEAMLWSLCAEQA